MWLVVATITPERTRPTDCRRLSRLTPSCADHRIEREEKRDPAGHDLATQKKERSELDGHRRIREAATSNLGRVNNDIEKPHRYVYHHVDDGGAMQRRAAWQ